MRGHRLTGDPVHVLHVDDDPEFAEMAATFVEGEDDRFDVEIATTASDGLDRLASDEFDCIVSDYDMPGTNGIEFLEAVREDYPDLPFILYTGKGSEEIASDAISAGVTDYLQKETGTSQYTVLANRIRNSVENYRTQIELADRETRLNLFFEQSPLGVVEWDENFEFVRMNDAAEEILGYDETEMTGRSWERIVPQSDRDDVAEVVSDLLENQGGYHSINENVRADGERIVCEWHNRVVTDDDGGVVAIFSQFQDITDRKRKEEALARQNERLDEFATLVSHDLRSPLTVADGRLELARDECDSDHLDLAKNAIQRSQSLIDDLLTLARDGETVGSLEPVNLGDVIEECWQTVDTMAATLSIDTDRLIRADRGQLQQLLENLVRNAVEHGGEEVTVTVGDLDDGFYVADDGTGIPEHQREQVFEPGHSTVDGGTGIGLAIVRQIVTAHDWEISVAESERGGARFEITDVDGDSR